MDITDVIKYGVKDNTLYAELQESLTFANQVSDVENVGRNPYEGFRVKSQNDTEPPFYVLTKEGLTKLIQQLSEELSLFPSEDQRTYNFNS